MSRLSVCIEAERVEAELEQIRRGMRRHSEQHVPWETYDDLTIVLRDDEGAFCGACLGETGRGWLNIGVMWIREEHRGQGHGRQLLAAAEAEALRRGCRYAYLDTFDYQAPSLYERCGYEVFGTLENYPAGHTRYFMRKNLQPA